MGLLTDIYNTVARFFRPQDEQFGEDPSKTVATNRLKLVLMQDRTNLTPKVLEQMRGEMIELLSKYLEMDKDLLELNFEQEGDQVALMLSIPVIRAKDEEEIEASMADSDYCDDDECLEEICESEDDVEEEVKPKKRRSKKVTPPDELESNCSHDECNCEDGNCECHNDENHNNECCCEHHEG